MFTNTTEIKSKDNSDVSDFKFSLFSNDFNHQSKNRKINRDSGNDVNNHNTYGTTNQICVVVS